MKANITDLDRTLLHTDKSISAYTLDVLNACHRAGIYILAVYFGDDNDDIEAIRMGWRSTLKSIC